jgi:pheromone shutdown protein TraB
MYFLLIKLRSLYQKAVKQKLLSLYFRRVAQELGVSLGEEVGYAIRFEDRTSHKTRIKYVSTFSNSISVRYMELIKYFC